MTKEKTTKTKKVLTSVEKDKKGPKVYEVTDLLTKNLFEVDFTLPSNKLLKQLYTRVASFIKKQLSLRESLEDKLAFVNSMNLHDSIQVSCTHIPLTSETMSDYNTLHGKMRKADRDKVKREELVMVLLKLVEEGKERKVLTLLGDDMKNIDEFGLIFNDRSKRAGTYVLSYSDVLSRALTAQLLFRFEQSQPNLLQESIVEYNIENNKLFAFPGEETFQKDFLAVAARLGAETSNAVTFADYHRSHLEEYFRKVFYGEGYLSNSGLISGQYGLVFNWLAKEFAKLLNSRKQFASNRAEGRQYAKVTDIKLNIPQTHLKRMKDNAFLSHFGEVELDQIVDLEKFKEFEEDFLEFKKLIPVPVRKDWTFKIRCLGNLKASGVCYPGQQISAVDRNGLSSFVHEVMGHQVDRILAPEGADFLSDTSVFRVIRNLYSKLVEEKINQLPEEHPARQDWHNAKIKFNKMYYLTPTEIFARCMEVYVSLKIGPNSVAKSKAELENSFYHSYDERLVELITPFFDEVLTHFKEDQPLEYNLLEVKEEKKETQTVEPAPKKKRTPKKVAALASAPDVKIVPSVTETKRKSKKKATDNQLQWSFDLF